MTMFNKRSVTALTLAISTVLLSACGGGSSGGGSSTGATASGFAVDGPLSGATVSFLSTAAACAGKTTQTNSEGAFSFPAGCTNSEIAITNGVDTTTGLAFTGTLKAPASAGTNKAIAVTPITTLIAAAGTDKADEILAALGLPTNIDLLSANPMLNKDLLAKTTAVQEMVEGISESLSQLGGSATPDSLNQAVVSAVAAKLATGAPVSLSNTTFLTDVIKSSVKNIAADLPADQRAKIDDVAANTAAMTATVIAKNINTVESTIASISNFSATNPRANVQSALAVKDNIVNSKSDVTSQNVVNLLKNLVTLPNVANDIANIATAISSANTTALQNALNTIKTNNPNVTLPSTSALAEANQFTKDYVYFGTVTVDGKRYTPNEIAQSFAQPIVTKTLDNILLDVATGGVYANSTQKFEATLKVDAVDRAILIHASELSIRFVGNGMVSGSAFLPKGSKITLTTKTTQGTFVDSEITLDKDINVSNGVNLALNSTTLGAISPALKTAFDELNAQNGTSIFTAVISPVNAATVATQYTDKLTFASKYTLSLGSKTYTGFGLKAKVTVQK